MQGMEVPIWLVIVASWLLLTGWGMLIWFSTKSAPYRDVEMYASRHAADAVTELKRVVAELRAVTQTHEPVNWLKAQQVIRSAEIFLITHAHLGNHGD